MDKSLFRKEILARRKKIYCADTDAKIIEQFLDSDLYKNADCHFCLEVVNGILTAVYLSS